MLTASLRRDGTRPLLTWYDDATGERIELSVATAANWAVKTANLLLDEGVEVVRLVPGEHWLAAVVALGAWTAGTAVGDDGDPLPGDPQQFMTTVLAQPDALMGAPPPPDATALAIGGRSWTLTELAEAAGKAAAQHGVFAGARVLSTWPLDTVHGIDAGLLIPLAVDGSVVLVANADAVKLDARAATERVTHRLG